MVRVEPRDLARGPGGGLSHADYLRELQRALRRDEPLRIWSREEEVVWAAATQKFREENGRLPDPRKADEFNKVKEQFNTWRNRLFVLANTDRRIDPDGRDRTPAENREFDALKREVTALATSYNTERTGRVRRVIDPGEGRVRIPPRDRDPEVVLPRRELPPRVDRRFPPADRGLPPVEPIRTRTPGDTMMRVATGIYRGGWPDEEFVRASMSQKMSTSTDRAFLARTGARNQGDVFAQIDDMRAFGAECRAAKRQMLAAEPAAFLNFRRAYMRENPDATDIPRGDNPALWPASVRKSQAYREFYTTMVGIRRGYADAVGESMRRRGYTVDTTQLEKDMGLPPRAPVA